MFQTHVCTCTCVRMRTCLAPIVRIRIPGQHTWHATQLHLPTQHSELAQLNAAANISTLRASFSITAATGYKHQLLCTQRKERVLLTSTRQLAGPDHTVKARRHNHYPACRMANTIMLQKDVQQRTLLCAVASHTHHAELAQ